MLMWLGRHFDGLHSVPVEQIDGRILYLNLAESMCLPYLLLGQIHYEAGETSFFKSILRPGDTAIDIGANVGWYTTLFAELVGPSGTVIAFEPNDTAFQLLARSVRSYKNMRAFRLAVADRSGEAELHIPTKAEGWFASLGDIEASRGTTVSRPCTLTTLDSFIADNSARRVTAIKVDTEGFEREVLRGARGLLSSSEPPLWVLETTPPGLGRYPPEEVYDILLAERKYSLYKIDGTSGALLPVPQTVTEVFNLAAIPGWLMDRLPRFEPARHVTASPE